MTEKKHGFTIVEILVAISISVILTGFLVAIFNNNKKAYNNNNRMIELNSNIRFAMATIREDLVNAGFYGGASNQIDKNNMPSRFNNGLCFAPTPTPTPMPSPTPPPSVIEFATATEYPIWGSQAASSSEIGCLSNITANTDFLSIRGVRGTPTEATALETDTVYIKSGLADAEFFAKGMSASIDSATDMNWKYYSHIYYICHNHLLRQALVYESNVATWQTQVLIGPEIIGNQCDSNDAHNEAGIENMQLSYGIDDDEDGVADYYSDGSAISGTGEWNDVVEIKIFILARSERDLAYTDSKTYNLGGVSVTPGGNFHRKVYSSTVFLRNNWYDIIGDPSGL